MNFRLLNVCRVQNAEFGEVVWEAGEVRYVKSQYRGNSIDVTNRCQTRVMHSFAFDRERLHKIAPSR